jgi:soluble lytic murein transglycosylase-like protein
MSAVIRTESSGNPYAIGVVNGSLVRQPKGLDEAVATVKMLDRLGYNYSLGAAQINKSNFKRFGLNQPEQSFDFCKSVEIGSKILNECYISAGYDWGKAFSCYYSGNYTVGFKHGYVDKVFSNLSDEYSRGIKKSKVTSVVGNINTNNYSSDTKNIQKQSFANNIIKPKSDILNRSSKMTAETLKGGASINKQDSNTVTNLPDDKAFVF